MSVGTNPQECLRLLDIEEKKFRDYENRWNIWDKEIEVFRQQRNKIQNDINIRDTALGAYILDKWSKAQVIGTNDVSQCAASPATYQTPLGLKLPGDQIFNGIQIFNSQAICRQKFDDTYFFREKGDIQGLIDKIYNEIQPKLNKISSRMPQPVSVILSCCLNKIDCTNGRCEGNVQLCRTTYTNLLNANQNSEIEANNLENIRSINNIINKYREEINAISISIIGEIQNYNSAIDKQNIEKTLKNLKIIYDNIKINLEKVTKITNDLKKYKEDAVRYNNNTRDVSTHKNNILNLLQSINNNINNINNSINTINDEYDFYKNTYDSIEKQNNDLILLNLNKMNIVSTIKIINDNIDNINILYESASNLNILSNIDLESLLDLFNKSTFYLENININNENLKNFYTTFINIFNKFPKNSKFFYIASDLNDEVKEKILDINNNIIKVNDTSKSINDIYILKKDLYDAKIIKEEQLLLESSNKKVEDNNINKNQTTPIIKENDEKNNTLMIVLIIVGSIFLILLII